MYIKEANNKARKKKKSELRIKKVMAHGFTLARLLGRQ